MTRHKIALISTFPPSTNSLNEYGYHLALSLAERDDVSEVCIIADKLPNDAPELKLGPKIKVHRVWKFNSFFSPLTIQKTLRAQAPDLALYNLQMASFGDWEIPAALGLLTPSLSRKSGILTGILAHNLFLGVDLEQTNMKGQPFRQFITKLGGSFITNLLLRADYTTVTLRSYAEGLAKSHPDAPVHLVPHGTFDKPQSIKKYENRPENIVTMGKFGTYKKLDTLLNAFCLVKPIASVEGPQLVIGGTDHPATPGYVRDCADQFRHRHDIEFLGYVAEDAVPEFFGDARIAVFDYESTTGSSGVLHQAASFGAPPLFPRIGDFIDLCEDEGLTGLHYEPGDAKGMANAMQTILTQPQMAASMAAKNYDAAHAFPISRVAEFHLQQIKQAEHLNKASNNGVSMLPAE